MKKLLLLTALAFAGFNNFASHMMGGQITAKNISGLDYEIKGVFYRDVTGIAISTSIAFCITDLATNTSVTLNIPQGTMTYMGNNTEEYAFSAYYTFPAAGNYRISMVECCRNPLSSNFLNPASFSFYVENIVWIDPSNSSPVFLNPPVPVAQLGVPFNYNPMPFDADGDSLTWQVDTPMSGSVACDVPVYVDSYVVPSADPLSPFTMDPLTGVISFLPNTIGSFQVSVLVNEFRNGVQIGQIRRDMQILVLASPNQPPTLTSGSNLYPYTGTIYNIAPGTSITLSILVDDSDGQGLSLVASGEPLLLTWNPAIVTTNTAPTNASATVSWTPDASQVRPAPYLLSMRITETFGVNQFSNDITYQLKVGNATGIKDNNADVVRGVYPNPSNGNFTVEMLSDKAQSVSLSISSIAGQQLRNIPYDLNAGVNLLNVRSLNIPDGTYILSIAKDGSVLQTRTFEIRNQ